MKSILLAQILTKFSYFDHILSSFPRRNRLWAGTSWLVCLPRATSEPLLTMRHRFRGASWCGLGRSCIEYRQNIKMTLQPSNVDCWYFGPHHGDEVVVVLQHRCLALNWGLSQRYWFGDIESSSKWYNMHLVFWTWASGHISDFMNSLGITSTMAVCEVNHDDHSEPGWSSRELRRSCQLPGLRGAFSRVMLAMFATFNKCPVFEVLREKQYFGDYSTRAMLCGQIYVLFWWRSCSEQGHRDTGIEKMQLSHNSISYCANLLLALLVKIPFSQ